MDRYGAIVVSWASAVPGREHKLLDVLHKVFAYGETLRKHGRISEVRFFVTKAGPYRDTIQMFGKLNELAPILVEQQFEGLLLEGSVVVTDINIALWEGSTPEWVSSGMASYVEALQRHGST
jgi:hypothetical protein